MKKCKQCGFIQNHEITNTNGLCDNCNMDDFNKNLLNSINNPYLTIDMTNVSIEGKVGLHVPTCWFEDPEDRCSDNDILNLETDG